MNILFYSKTNNMNTGSYRIWVNDLNQSLKELGYKSEIVYSMNDLLKKSVNFDAVIFCKSAYEEVDNFKKQNNKKIPVGAINVACDYYSDNIDFVIVGSLEEYVSLSKYENVFIVPLIERKFENSKIKLHIDKKKDECLRICFHGHYPHLFKLEPFIKNAIERVNNELIKTQLVVISGHPNFDWKVGRPNVEIEHHGYNDNFENIIKTCDIGIVPNVSDLRLFVKDISNLTSIDWGLYNTDYFLRMKNKTNAGRAYVFYQLGIPVIHDLSPSSFELISKSGYNLCAHDEHSYFREIKKLLCPSFRNTVAIKNNEIFKHFYNCHDHAKKLINAIEEIK